MVAALNLLQRTANESSTGLPRSAPEIPDRARNVCFWTHCSLWRLKKRSFANASYLC